MSESFAAGALRLAALAAIHLRWTPRTFWGATPSELAACLAPPAPAETPPSRAEIAAMIERDAHG
ncbi:phage tail assembly chaperone [Qipengyuania flava]|uniref:phage tail assembly chaperone n=1 Tax=Qipengyuania flava TaxID=192812 RepID=UPI001C629297|nr:phage tail assembly chaperone [Qipengyuania flava]QYJ07155.1 phage tail assembly chaperone [Qipengyuania flava]